jgi:hypothetical protein
MSATSRGNPADRLWTAFVPRRSSLRRPSDRAETAARWIAVVLLVVAVPFLLALGSTRAQDLRDEGAALRASSQEVVGTVTAITPPATGAGGIPAGPVGVVARWVAPDGSAHTASGVAGRGARVGAPWSFRVDAAGRVVRPPVTDEDATTQGVLLSFWAFLACVTGLVGLLALLRVLLDRRRMRDWDEDWALFGLGRGRGVSG